VLPLALSVGVFVVLLVIVFYVHSTAGGMAGHFQMAHNVTGVLVPACLMLVFAGAVFSLWSLAETPPFALEDHNAACQCVRLRKAMKILAVAASVVCCLALAATLSEYRSGTRVDLDDLLDALNGYSRPMSFMEALQTHPGIPMGCVLTGVVVTLLCMVAAIAPGALGHWTSRHREGLAAGFIAASIVGASINVARLMTLGTQGMWQGSGFTELLIKNGAVLGGLAMIVGQTAGTLSLGIPMFALLHVASKAHSELRRRRSR
jgi:hypothetical protein